MRVGLKVALSDANLDLTQASNQRQLSIAIAALTPDGARTAPLNLCLVLDHSGSMQGRPLETVKQAAYRLLEQLTPDDRISVVAFDHNAKVLVPNQAANNLTALKFEIGRLTADGGTAIDEGLKLGIEELARGKQNKVSQILLLTDGENEHGDNDRCLKLAELAARQNFTVNTLGFGNHWNQDVLEKLADAGGGALAYIQRPEAAIEEFSRLFSRMQSIGLTNAHLLLSLAANVRLAELKPIAQVLPETIELTPQMEEDKLVVRLGDLMIDAPRVVLVNLYLSQLQEGPQTLGRVQVRYDDPAIGQTHLLSESVVVEAIGMRHYQPQPNPEVQTHILALAKYRQTQIAETRLQQGDRAGAATLLQSAAKTALQMGDRNAATVLQENATRLQTGEDLSEADRKKTRIVSKTILQP